MKLLDMLKRIYAIHAVSDAMVARRQPSNELLAAAGLEHVDMAGFRYGPQKTDALASEAVSRPSPRCERLPSGEIERTTSHAVQPALAY